MFPCGLVLLRSVGLEIFHGERIQGSLIEHCAALPILLQQIDTLHWYAFCFLLDVGDFHEKFFSEGTKIP